MIFKVTIDIKIKSIACEGHKNKLSIGELVHKKNKIQLILQEMTFV